LMMLMWMWMKIRKIIIKSYKNEKLLQTENKS